jgi:hypothetical protein
MEGLAAIVSLTTRGANVLSLTLISAKSVLDSSGFSSRGAWRVASSTWSCLLGRGICSKGLEFKESK